MTSIRSFAEVLLEEEGLTQEDRERFVGIIHQESLRLTRLLDEILDLNRMDAGDLDLRLVRLDPATTLHESVAAMAGFAHQRGVTLEDAVPAKLPEVIADADRLKQVLINLIHNAIKFNDAREPEVRVSAEVSGREVVLSVSDNGPGVPAADQTVLFRKLPRRGGEREGSGLGLAICRQIVEAHRGRIELRPGVGKGARFEVVLPQATTKNEASSLPAAVASAGS